MPEHRPIRQSELDVIRATLACASVVPVDKTAEDTIATLQVVSRCGCGCATVDFAEPASDQRSSVVAEGVGNTPKGGLVGVIVWGRPDAITGLEIYDMGAGEGEVSLPLPESMRRWD